MTLPSFLIIGAAKAATSSLHQYLGQHPDVGLGYGKEPSFFAFAGESPHFAGPGDHFFAEKVVTDLDAYRACFGHVADKAAIGEASVLYLYAEQAAARIHQQIPEVRLIAILRDPAERAYSSYLHLRRDGREPIADFEAALREEEARIRQGFEHQWHYTRLGFYFEQLQRYFELFPKEQLAVVLYEDLEKDSVQVVQSLFAFIGVDPSFEPDVSVRHNPSGVPTFPQLHDFLSQPGRLKGWLKPVVPAALRARIIQLLEAVKRKNIAGAPEPMPQSARAALRDLYREDVTRLETLIGRDLSAWK